MNNISAVKILNLCDKDVQFEASDMPHTRVIYESTDTECLNVVGCDRDKITNSQAVREGLNASSCSISYEKAVL